MTGTLAQLIALTAYGNDYLKNGKLPENFYPENTAFQFCNKADFRISVENVVAIDPIEWFKYLKNDGCKALRLFYLPSKDQSAKDHQLAAFVGGGGLWLIEAIYNTYSNFWANRWQVTNQNDPDKKIWTVNYALTSHKEKSINLQINPEKIKVQLQKTLTEIAEFASRQNLKIWKEKFEKAIEALNSQAPNEDFYHKNLIPADNYSLTARQVLFAAGMSWVFGGMGSWNDLGFQEQDTNDMYNKLSEQLYNDIIYAVISATNSY